MPEPTVADLSLSVDELKRIIREVVAQTLSEMPADPDAGLEIRDDFKRELQSALSGEEEKTSAAQDVAARLGLTW